MSDSLRRRFNDGRLKKVEYTLETQDVFSRNTMSLQKAHYCETIPYASAYSKEFVESSGDRPFLLGFIKATAEFERIKNFATEPDSIPISFRRLGEFRYTVPIFGRGELTSFDRAVITDFYDQNFSSALDAYESRDLVKVKKLRKDIVVRQKSFSRVVEDTCGVASERLTQKELTSCYEYLKEL